LTVDPPAITFARGAGQTSAPVDINVLVPEDPVRTSIVVDVVGPNASDFRIDWESCPDGSPVGACTLSASFLPPAGPTNATKTATLTVRSLLTSPSGEVSSETATIPLTGVLNAEGPLVPLILSALDGVDMGHVEVDTAGAAAAFSVYNVGDTPVGPLTVSFTSDEFALVQDDCTGTILARQETCYFRPTFKPVTAGRVSGLVAVEGAGASKIIAALSGVGMDSLHPIINPDVVDFGRFPDAETIASRTIVIQNLKSVNTGTLAVQWSGTGYSDHLQVTQNGCSAALAAGASCAFTAYHLGPGASSVAVMDGAATLRRISTRASEDPW
jgi:hypothetical protein